MQIHKKISYCSFVSYSIIKWNVSYIIMWIRFRYDKHETADWNFRQVFNILTWLHKHLVFSRIYIYTYFMCSGGKTIRCNYSEFFWISMRLIQMNLTRMLNDLEIYQRKINYSDWKGYLIFCNNFIFNYSIADTSTIHSCILIFHTGRSLESKAVIQINFRSMKRDNCARFFYFVNKTLYSLNTFVDARHTQIDELSDLGWPFAHATLPSPPPPRHATHPHAPTRPSTFSPYETTSIIRRCFIGHRLVRRLGMTIVANY